jgi:hypothetical protein
MGGNGARQRSPPTGGMAKGTPLKLATLPSVVDVPDTRPFKVLTVGFCAVSPIANSNKASSSDRHKIGLFIQQIFG